jgi:hypothetical protein
MIFQTRRNATHRIRECSHGNTEATSALPSLVILNPPRGYTRNCDVPVPCTPATHQFVAVPVRGPSSDIHCDFAAITAILQAANATFNHMMAHVESRGEAHWNVSSINTYCWLALSSLSSAQLPLSTATT